MIGTSTVLLAAAANVAVATKCLCNEGTVQYLQDLKDRKAEKEAERERENKERERVEYHERMEENYKNYYIKQGEVELKKLNLEKFGFKLDEVALTYTDAFTYLIHDIKTDKKRWMMLSQIKEMIENSQRIQ